MANCELCGQKLPFMGGEAFLAGETVQRVTVGQTYTLCSNCVKLVNAAKKKEPSAQSEVRELVMSSEMDEHKREWMLSYLKIPKTREELDAIENHAREQAQLQQEYKAYQSSELSKMKEALSQQSASPVFDVDGCRGRRIKVYPGHVVLYTDATLGAIMTGNATDGAKTIFYHDIVGIQYKEPGLTIGYLQLETAAGQMNNLSSNQFSENTFTFETDTDTVRIMRDYITWRVSQYKQL